MYLVQPLSQVVLTVCLCNG